MDVNRIVFDNVKEAARLAEVYVQAQTQVAIAADQRSVSFSSTIAAMLTATIGGTIALSISDKTNFYLVTSGFSCSMFLIFAFFNATNATKPVKFHFPGSYPNTWNEVDLCENITHALWGLLNNCQCYIDENEKVLKQNARQLRRAQWYTFISPILGLFGFLLSYYAEITSLEEAVGAGVAVGVAAAAMAVVVEELSDPSHP